MQSAFLELSISNKAEIFSHSLQILAAEGKVNNAHVDLMFGFNPVSC